jgi:hypothetical protein
MYEREFGVVFQTKAWYRPALRPTGVIYKQSLRGLKLEDVNLKSCLPLLPMLIFRGHVSPCYFPSSSTMTYLRHQFMPLSRIFMYYKPVTDGISTLFILSDLKSHTEQKTHESDVCFCSTGSRHDRCWDRLDNLPSRTPSRCPSKC